MAFTKDTTFKGINVSGAYHKVTVVNVSKTSMEIGVQISVAKDQESFDSKFVLGAPYNLEGENPIAQAYAYLKTLPEYREGTDC